MPKSPSIDALLPPEMAAKAEAIGAAKARMPAGQMLSLAVLAGAFIALGATFSLKASVGLDDIPAGIRAVVAGLTFSLGLVLVVVAGAELFTGNNLIVMAWAGRRASLGHLLRNWGVVYVGNFIGAALTAWMVHATGLFDSDTDAGANALRVAEAKCQLGFGEAFTRGVLCNALVCLAVWLSFSARTTTDRILAVVPPVTAFVACGFEHCVANMFFGPLGLAVKGTEAAPGGFDDLTFGALLTQNLIPVTLGNIVGGTVLVGLTYWFIYRRGTEDPAQD